MDLTTQEVNKKRITFSVSDQHGRKPITQNMTLFFFFWKAEKQFRKSGLSIESVGNNLVVEIGSSNLTVAFFYVLTTSYQWLLNGFIFHCFLHYKLLRLNLGQTSGLFQTLLLFICLHDFIHCVLYFKLCATCISIGKSDTEQTLDVGRDVPYPSSKEVQAESS